jgi:hypothetical protein
MIISQNYKGYLEAKIKANRKIKVKDEEIVDKLNELFDYIELFNTLPERTYQFMGRPLSDIMVMNEISDCILPDSIRVHPTDVRSKDLMVRPKLSKKLEAVKPSYNDFMNIQSVIRGWLKLDVNSGMTALSSLKAPKSISDVEERISFVSRVENGEVLNYRYGDQPFVPIIVSRDYCKAVYREDYFNSTDLDVVLDDYFANFKF